MLAVVALALLARANLFKRAGDTSGSRCQAGTVEDCSGDGDCCSESWVGDGIGDCWDQAFGCDLSCYADDDGDCAAGRKTASRPSLPGSTLTGISVGPAKVSPRRFARTT